jgi:hypothetical protein
MKLHHRLHLILLTLGSSLLAGCPSTPLNLPSTMTGYQLVMPPGSTLAPNSTLSVSAACPQGKVVVGGGWSSNMDTATVMNSSAALAGGGGWTVTASNANLIGSSIFLRPFAVCVNRPGGYAITSTAASLQNQEVNSFEAACPSAAHVATGGGISTASGDVRTFSQGIVSQPAPQRYRVGGRSTLLLPGRSSFTPSAVCADFTQVPGLEIVLSPSASVGPRSTVSLSADCPNGKTVLHGAVQSLDSGLVVIESLPVNLGATWGAMIHNPSILGASMAARLQVVCASTAS